MNLSTQQKTDSKTRYQTCGWQGGESGGGIEWEFRISRCNLLGVEWINNNVLLHGPRNYIKYSVINYPGK